MQATILVNAEAMNRSKHEHLISANVEFAYSGVSCSYQSNELFPLRYPTSILDEYHSNTGIGSQTAKITLLDDSQSL
jgi:hypothetical protein